MGYFWQRRPIISPGLAISGTLSSTPKGLSTGNYAAVGYALSTANSTAAKFKIGYLNYFGSSAGAKTYHLPVPFRGATLMVHAVAASTATTKTKLRASTVSATATVLIQSSVATKQSLLFQKKGQYAQLLGLSTTKWLVVAASPNLTATSS